MRADRVFLWTSIASGSTALACLSVIAPATYILTMATLAAVGVVAGTLVIGAMMLDAGPIGWLWAGDVVKIGLQLAIAILQAAAGVSGSSND